MLLQIERSAKAIGLDFKDDGIQLREIFQEFECHFSRNAQYVALRTTDQMALCGCVVK